MEHSSEELKSVAYRRWSITLKRIGREMHGPCPFCMAGDDRFIIWPQGNYWCRQCMTSGWIDDDRRDWRPDPSLAPRLRELREAEDHERERRLQEWKEAIERDAFMRGWHSAMQATHREYWRGRGVGDWAIDYYGLGFCPDKVFLGPDKQPFHSPAYTIPIREPVAWDVVNIQYRLVGVEADIARLGKYRQEANIPAAAFYAQPHTLDGDVIVVEGAVKTIVLYDLMKYDRQIIGWPSMTPAMPLIETLASFRRVFLILDPPTPRSHHPQAIERIAGVLKDKLRVASLAMKPDDAVLQRGMTRDQFETILRQARRVA